MHLGVPGLSGWSSPAPAAGIDHLFIVRALILRDIRTKYRGNPLGIMTEFLRIGVVIVAHYLFFSLANRPMPANVPIEVFVIGAFAVWFAFSRTVTAADSGAKWAGGASLIPGVTRMHLRLAKSAWAVLSNLFFCLFCAVGLRLYGDEVSFADVPLTVVIFAIIAGLGFGLGLLLEGLERLWPLAQQVGKIAIWVLFVSCGIYFSEATTTPALAEIFWFNPVLHLVEYQRYAFDPGYPVALLNLIYPTACAAGLVLMGLMLNRWLRHQRYA